MTVPEGEMEPPGRPAGRAARPAPGRGLAVRDAGALIFAADMYGVQLDQLALLAGGERAARAAAARWRALGYAETARLGPGPAWLWVTKAGARRLRAALLPGAARAVPARAHPGGRGGADRARGDERLRARRGVLALRAPDQVAARGRRPAAPARRRGALAGRLAARGAGRVGRRVLGGRGRALAQDRRADRRDHAGDPHPHRRLRLPGRRRLGPRAPAAARPRALPVLARRARHRPAGPGRARPAGGAGRGPRPAARRAAPVAAEVARGRVMRAASPARSLRVALGRP